MSSASDDRARVVAAAGGPSTPRAEDLDALRAEIAYYARHADAVAGECVRLDLTVSGLKHEIRQKRKAFSLLAQLQRTINLGQEIASVYALVIQAINATLGMDRTIVLTPRSGGRTFVPSQWLGFPAGSAPRLRELAISIPAEHTAPGSSLLVHRSTPTSSVIRHLQTSLEMPYFVAVPVGLDADPVAMLVSGRLREARPFYPPLDQGDVETFQAIAGLISSAIQFQRSAVLQAKIQQQSREVELSQLKSEFVANVTHELKTPLALIRLYGETLESGLVTDDAQRQEFATIIRRESERLTHLINNVLDFGRIDAGAKAYTFVNDDLASVIRDALDAYRYFLDRAGMAVEADLPARPVSMRLDRDAIAQALVNLLQNAMKYGANGRYVQVCVRPEGADVLVEVTDRGAGIPGDELERIFEKYHRVGGEQAGGEGSGLGLAIVKHAVEAHGGRVRVRSVPGQGSTFTMRLPLAPDAVGARAVAGDA